MIKNRELVEKFEKELIKKARIDIEKNMKIFNELLFFAKELGKIPPENPLEGIEIDIKYARIINGIKKTY